MTVKVYLLRILHALFALYFLLCLVYLYYAAFHLQFGTLLLVALISLGIEGFIVFFLNNGDCPLIHVQKKIGDDKPFFELFFPPKLAKKAIPIFSVLAWIAFGLLLIRYFFH